MKIQLTVLGLILATKLLAGTTATTISPVAWNIILEEEKVISKVLNNSNEDLICSKQVEVSMHDETGYDRQRLVVTFANQIIPARQMRYFELNRSNLNREYKMLSFGDVKTHEKEVCVPFNGTGVEITKAITGALRNSDLEAAKQAYQLATNKNEIKYLDLSNSNFNSDLSFLNLNYVDTTNTPYEERNPPTDDGKVCKRRKNAICGFMYFEKQNKLCKNTECCLATDKNNNCTLEFSCSRKSLTPAWCRIADHGVEDVWSCFNQKTKSGDWRLCNPVKGL
ncbi:hypothetical protein ACJVC5_18805 [Peredibacter sp. HCB2-198]|uniref:hypothetical protein n=1 Tax=Peredibacter sp. HCB2-198 TaxID=3383025 RepID=UPI0038B456D8